MFSTAKMTGGLVFGPPAWHPSRIEDAFDEAPLSAAGSQGPPAPRTTDCQPPPATLNQLRDLLKRLHLERTSPLFPALLEQLQSLGEQSPRALVLNLLPTQPEFALPAALTRLALPELLEALRLLIRTLRPRLAMVVLDRHDRHARRLWKRALQSHSPVREQASTAPPPRIVLKSLLNRYPQAHPTLLAQALFSRRLPVGALPPEIGCIFVDPVGMWALGRHLQTGEPFAWRPVQLFTQSAPPRLVMARLGESIEQLCRRFQVPLPAPAECQIICNGMLIGRIAAFDTPIAADTESITLREPPAAEQPSACITCGWCVDVCPTALNPVELFQLAQKTAAPPRSLDIRQGRPAPEYLPVLRSGAARESLHCIACGLCSYVCPTRLPLMDETLTLRSRVQAAAPPAPIASAP